MRIRHSMKRWGSSALLCLSLIAASTATATSLYEISFSGTSPLPTSGSFFYDPTTSTFSDFIVTWDGLTFDLTVSANNPTIGNAAPSCVGAGTPGSQTFALLSGSCDGPTEEFTGWEALDNGGVSYFDFETEKIAGIFYDSLTDSGVNQGQGSTGFTTGSFSITPVPEPSTTGMFIGGLVLLVLGSRKNLGIGRRALGLFAALASAASLSSAAAISYVDLFTTNTYNQTSASQPTLSAGYFLTAHLYLQNPGDFSAANLTVPGGAQPANGTNNGVAPDMALANSTTFQYQSPTLAAAAFNSEFQAGDYTYTATGSPNDTLSLYYAADPDYSTSVPYVTDYSSLQGMNSAHDFDLTLNPFTNALPGGNCVPESGDTCSYVFLSIYDTSGNGVFGQGYAPNTTTSFDIPAGTLQPGQTYTYSLIFSNQQVGSYDSDNNNWIYDPEYWSDVSTNGTFSTAAAAVTAPEPSTMGMLAGGLALIVLGSRKKLRAGGRALGLGAVAALFTSVVSAQVSSHARPKITQAIQENQTIIRSGNVHPAVFASTTTDLGPMDDHRVLNHMRLQLQRTPEEAKALQEYVDSLSNPKSPNFHQFVTAAQFSEQWGLAQSDINAVTKWLTSHGFAVHFIYPTLAIDFSGSAKQIKETFHTEIHNLRVNGESHFANVTDIQIPAALAQVVLGPVALHDFKPRRLARGIIPRVHPDLTVSASLQIVAPGDLATIYNLTPLFNAGITGQGQTIVVLSESDLYSVGDFNTFRKSFGLSRLYPLGKLITVHPQPTGSSVTSPNGVEISSQSCADPGVLAGDDREAATDVEWISASAPNATIELAACADTDTHFGIFVALENLITSPGLPPSIVNLSYAESEADRGAIGNAFINALYQVAASEGISMFVCAGDGGASPGNGSDGSHGIGVNGLASTPNNVAVGGTDYEDTYLGARPLSIGNTVMRVKQRRTQPSSGELNC